MNNVLAVILGGGRGERLYPLTKLRAKPALPLAGKYRLIDIPVSNCINSGIHRVYVLTQFNSASLHRHIANTYRFYPFMNGFVDVLAAQQTPVSPDWFQGTADAVRKTLWVMEPHKVDDYLILAGDHLYRMDYRDFVGRHRETDADVTISVLPIEKDKASGFGLMKIGSDGRVTEFREKPAGDELTRMKVDTRAFGLDDATAAARPYLASMGIYVFKREALRKLLLDNPDCTDFGKDIIPLAIRSLKVQSFVFNGYWEDIGTIESFYRANLSLVKQPDPLFSFYDSEFPIFTRARFLPPSKILDSRVTDSMVCDGCIIRSSSISNSLLGIRTFCDNGSTLENVLIMGADDFESDRDKIEEEKIGIPRVGIGVNSIIRNAIIDKNARIGKNVRIVNKQNLDRVEREADGYWIRNGIVIIMKGATIPDNTVI
jgi:glucose-1-phosphate adenylyltransferase